MTKATKTIVFGYEGVLADVTHRADLQGDWDNYNEALDDDSPIPEIVELVEHLSEFYTIVVWTVTDEKYRQQMMHWLVDHGIMADDIVMRNNYDPEVDIKLGWCEDIEPFIVYEHKTSVCDSLKDSGQFTIEV